LWQEAKQKKLLYCGTLILRRVLTSIQELGGEKALLSHVDQEQT
jgi:hypothetical protein